MRKGDPSPRLDPKKATPVSLPGEEPLSLGILDSVSIPPTPSKTCPPTLPFFLLASGGPRVRSSPTVPGLHPDGSRLPRTSQEEGPSWQSRDPSAAPSPTSPRTPGLTSLPGATGRSPAENLARAPLRGRAAGRDSLAGGRRAAEHGARLANLRRRSPNYVYLGHLTPALPAWRGGRPLADLPVGRLRPSGGARSVHAGSGRGAGGRLLCRSTADQTGQREWVGRGRCRGPL